MKGHELLIIVFYLYNIIVKLRTTRFWAIFFGHLAFPWPLKYGNLENIIVQNKKLAHVSNRLVIGVRGRIQPRMNGPKSNYPLTSLSRQKIHIICRCIPCQAMNWTWSDNRNFPKLAKNSGQLRLNSTFLPFSTCRMQKTLLYVLCVVLKINYFELNLNWIGKHAIKWLLAADRNHVNTSWGDTVKCRLDAGKSPIFWSHIRTVVAMVLGFRT